MSRETAFLEGALHAARTARLKGAPINPVIAAAMAALETGFGKSTPPNSNNVLGIKAGSSWDGPTVDAKTHEYTPAGQRYPSSASWRVYPSVQACFEDYGKIIGSLWWYEDAVASKDDPRAFLEALKPIYREDGGVAEPGYFTDPLYAEKVWSIVERYGLLDEPEQPRKRLKVHRDRQFQEAFDIPEGYRVVIAYEADGNVNLDIRKEES